MRYDVELSDAAAGVLESVPDEAAQRVHDELNRLAEAPLALGRRAHFPYRPVGQIYDFWCDEPGSRRFVTVFFHFKPGEEAIRVYAITVREYHPPDEST